MLYQKTDIQRLIYERIQDFCRRSVCEIGELIPYALQIRARVVRDCLAARKILERIAQRLNDVVRTVRFFNEPLHAGALHLGFEIRL
jgi:phosphate uptake regulator